jgi:predicted nucleotidyltransferase component of viral defense system
MLDKETLKKIAKLYGLKSWQQEKHYIQNLVLVVLSEYPLVFKGGTYLWFFHGLERFSEDLDFTTESELPNDLGEKVSEGLSLFGVENTIKKISEDERSFSFRITADGPLQTSERDRCYVYIEISRREKVIQNPLSLELGFDAYKVPVKIIKGMTLEETAAEKVRAIMTRNKARDLYDLEYLIKKKGVSANKSLINEKIKYYGLSFSYGFFENKIKEKKENYATELGPLVFGKIPDFSETEKTILNWIKG